MHKFDKIFKAYIPDFLIPKQASIPDKLHFTINLLMFFAIFLQLSVY
jgi:hypothetical protein